MQVTMSMTEYERLTNQRDNAWAELAKIREAVEANEDESTLDEVCRVVSQLELVRKDLELSNAVVSRCTEDIRRINDELSSYRQG